MCVRGVCVRACVRACMHVCVCGCVCVCVCVQARARGMNWKCALRWHIHIKYQFIPYCASAIHAHILKPFEDNEPTGLQVNIADWDGGGGGGDLLVGLF